MQPLLRIERVVIDGAARDVLGSLGLPADVVDQWSRFNAPLIRTVLTARPGAGAGPGSEPWSGGEIVGAAITVSRPLASYLRIGGIWVNGDGSGDAGSDRADVARTLTETAEELAWESGHIVVKREYLADDPDWEMIEAPEFNGPIPDSTPRIASAQFKWRHRTGRSARPEPSTQPASSASARHASVPYMRQTTDFTCGTATLSMLLVHRGLLDRLARDTELALWRQATTIGACDPYGLAIAADGRGLQPRIVINTDDTLFLEDLKTEEDRELKRFIQNGFKRQAADAGTRVERRTFEMEELAQLVRGGGCALVLVDELLVHDDRCPHWILVHSMEDGCFIAHDPWTEVAQGESWLDAYDIPLPPEALDRMAWTGAQPARAMIAFPRD